MKLYIFKFRNDPEGTVGNYFHRPDYIDKIIIDQVLDIPNFNQEYLDQEDAGILRTSDFDFTVSLTNPTTSAVQGKTIKPFLFDGLNRFIVVAELGTSPQRYYTGTIDLAGLQANLTYNKNNYEITIPVIGILKELSEYLSSFTPPSIPSNEELGYHISAHLFRVSGLDEHFGLNVSKVQAADSLLGWNATIDRGVQNYMVENNTINCWEAYKALARYLGLFTKIDFQPWSLDTNYPHWLITPFWNTDPLTTSDINIMEHIAGINYKPTKPYTLIMGMEFHAPNLPDRDTRFWHGILMTQNDYVVKAGALTLSNCFQTSAAMHRLSVMWHGATPTYIPLDEIEQINLADLTPSIAGPFDYYAIKAAYPWIIRHTSMLDGQGEILEKIVRLQTQYLIEGVKERKNLKIYIPDNSTLDLLNRVNINDGVSRNYSVTQIRNYNINDKTANIELLEV